MFQYSMTQWVSGKESCEKTAERLKKCGYDGIELSAEPYSSNVEKTKNIIEKFGLTCTSLCGIYPSERDLSAADQKIRKNAVSYVKDSIDMAVYMGCKTLIVVPSAIGKNKPDLTYEDAWKYSRESLAEAAEYAEKTGVFLALEAVNRFETFLINQMEDSKKMIKELGHPNIKMMADLFHMNIEERDMEQALKAAEKYLVHVHLADNTREPPGMGQTDFYKVYQTLQKIGYTGYLTMEFMPRVANPYLASERENEENLFDSYTKQALCYCKQIEIDMYRKQGG